MASARDWRVPAALQPNPGDYAYDLEATLAAMVGLRSIVPADAFTAETLGTERAGNGVIIRNDGLVLTVGYLITEAETVWLTLADGRAVQGHALAYDHETGFGLVQPLARLDLPALALGRSADAAVDHRVVIGGAGGRTRSVASRIVQKQEFAGYWEYIVDEALFLAPAHPNWGGTAVIAGDGTLIGIGSLQLQRGDAKGEFLNMAIPIDRLTPVLDDLTRFGRSHAPAKPWLGLYAAEAGGRLVVIGLASGGPAQRAMLAEGDVIHAVAGSPVLTLAEFLRRVWALGEAGAAVPLTIEREGQRQELTVISGDRRRHLRTPRLH